MAKKRTLVSAETNTSPVKNKVQYRQKKRGEESRELLKPPPRP